MYVGEDFPDTTPNEIRNLAFNFVDALAPTDSIVSAEWICEVAADSNVPDPTARGKITSLSQSGLIAVGTLQSTTNGVKYIITCIATALSGQKPELSSYILSNEPT